MASPKLRLTGLADPSQIDDLLVDLAPAQRALEARVVVIQLKTEPPLQLLGEDLATLLRRKAELITIVRTPQQGAVTMLIRELQYEELQEPERTKTVVVSNWQINLLVSALTKPRNASMLFEHTPGSPEIPWGFEVNPGKGYILEIIRSEFTRSDLAV